MKQLTTPDIRRRIYAAMSAKGITDKEVQRDLILQYTEGRTDSSKEMYQVEAFDLLDELHGRQRDPADKMRKKIIHYAHLIGWKTPAGKVDMRALNSWCNKYGMFHKKLNDHTTQELAKLTSQMENVFKSYLKNV